tara:strand:- start:40 stop:777 length:738 start_codon:yes stop_codon:yes gene_type:complete
MNNNDIDIDFITNDEVNDDYLDVDPGYPNYDDTDYHYLYSLGYTYDPDISNSLPETMIYDFDKLLFDTSFNFNMLICLHLHTNCINSLTHDTSFNYQLISEYSEYFQNINITSKILDIYFGDTSNNNIVFYVNYPIIDNSSALLTFIINDNSNTILHNCIFNIDTCYCIKIISDISNNSLKFLITKSMFNNNELDNHTIWDNANLTEFNINHNISSIYKHIYKHCSIDKLYYNVNDPYYNISYVI